MFIYERLQAKVDVKRQTRIISMKICR